MLGKIVLWFTAIIFTGYGVACLLSPEMVAGLAGLSIVNGDGFVEIGAMYGGLQTGFGLFCLLGALRRDLYRPALALLVLVIGSLALGRLYSATTTTVTPLGIYTWGAMTYEFTTAILAAWALKLATHHRH